LQPRAGKIIWFDFPEGLTVTDHNGNYVRPPAPGVVTVLKIFAWLFFIAAVPGAALDLDRGHNGAGIGAFLESILGGVLLMAAASVVRKLHEIEIYLRPKE
jgi:hypothetical protein